MDAPAAAGGGGLLSRLRRAVKKIGYLLNLNINRWRVASMLSIASRRRRPLSFNDRSGLIAAYDTTTDDDGSPVGSAAAAAITSSSSSCSSTYSRGGGISRTTSFPDEDDVDKRAELFIANFYRQLRMERQISLHLTYPPSSSSSSSSSSSAQFSPT